MPALISTALVIILLALAGSGYATPVGYNVTQPSAAGPPYPAAPLLFDVLHGLPPEPTHVLAVQLFDASYPPDPITPLPLALGGSVAGAPGGSGISPAGVSPSPFALVAFLPTAVPDFPPEPIHFDVLFDLRPHAAAPRSLRLAVPPEPIVPDGQSFDVFFDVFDGVGTVSHVAHFAIGTGQPLEFQRVQVGPPQSPAFHLTFDLALQQPGDVPLDAALFDMQVQGTFTAVPEPASGVLLLAGLAGLLVRQTVRRRR